jgi:flagellar biosynthesis anti-sigma factor FlgM
MSFGSSIGDVKQALTPLAPVSEAQTARTGTTSHAPSGAAPQADEASLSSTGGLIAQALGTSDVRTAKVEAVRSAISDGSYNVPSSAVAGKIIDSMLG